MSKFTPDYQNFFLKSNAGKEFMQTLETMKDSELTSAKKHPELSRDHIQRLTGIDSVLDHIKSVTFERKPIGAK